MAAWTRKDERQYEHIKESNRQRGKSTRRSKEIAARTVNKTRREAGKTSQSRTQGTGNPNRSLTQRSKAELYNRARDLNVAGRSSMTKEQLVQAIRRRTR